MTMTNKAPFHDALSQFLARFDLDDKRILLRLINAAWIRVPDDSEVLI